MSADQFLEELRDLRWADWTEPDPCPATGIARPDLDDLDNDKETDQ